jgi:hypothetical protein
MTPYGRSACLRLLSRSNTTIIKTWQKTRNAERELRNEPAVLIPQSALRIPHFLPSVTEGEEIPPLLRVRIGKLCDKRVMECRLGWDPFKRRHDVGIHGDTDDIARHLQISMRAHERRWVLVIVEIASEGGMDYSDSEVLVDFEMQMRRIKPVRISYGTDLLSSVYRLTFGDQNLV